MHEPRGDGRSTSFPFRTRRVHISDGKVAYFDQGEGPAVVLVHGLVGDFTHFEHVATRLISSGHRVIGVDLPGCGASHKRRARHDLGLFARDVLELMDVLGLPSATLAGHSAGGAICAEVALRAPHRVERLVLLSSAGLRRYGRTASLAARFLLTRPMLERTLERMAMPLLELVLVEKNGYTERFVRDALDRPVHPTLREMAHVMAGLMPELVVASVLERADRLAMPVLVLFGDSDRLVPEASARELSQRLPGITLRRLSSCGHMPMIERPEAVARELAAFLAPLRASAARGAARDGLDSAA